MHLNFHYSNQKQIFNLHEGSVPFLSFRALDETGMFTNGFSTRLGGVSEGCYASMNLTYAKTGEKPEHVLENYRRISKAVGFDMERAVVSQQTHTTNIRVVTEADYGKGVVRERGYTDVDGLVTNVPGLTLVTFYADCVPLYIADPVHRAVGLSHSGWRGTVHRMGLVTVQKMQELYGSRPEDLICCIGPSICGDCFEVGGEVAEEFLQEFGEEHAEALIRDATHMPLQRTEDTPVQEAEHTPVQEIRHMSARNAISASKKYYVDLWRANELVFLESGVRQDHIFTTNICTRCNPELLWSHRIFGEKRGNLAAFLALRENTGN